MYSYFVALLVVLKISVSQEKELTCLGLDNTLSQLSDIPSIAECLYVCQDTDTCIFYTYTDQGGHCILYSYCDLVLDGCPGDSPCYSGSPNNASCNAPPAPELGTWSCSSTTMSTTCTLQCQASYTPYPRSMTTCVGGHWSSAPESLLCEAGLVLVTGGYDGYAPWTAEIYSPDTSNTCHNISLPDLPDYRFYHSLDYVDGQVTFITLIIWPPKDKIIY